MPAVKRAPGLLARLLARLGRALDPDAVADRKRLRALLTDWRARDRDNARREQNRLKEMVAAMQKLAEESRFARRDLKRVHAIADSHRQLMGRLIQRTTIDRRAVQQEQRVAERLTRLSQSRLPIVVGPWTGEVGFELLYWIPFLQWVRETYPFDGDRLIVLSRGGVRSWYGHFSDQYEEIFNFCSPAAFRGPATDEKKQRFIRSFDRELIKQVMRARGITRCHVLHPTLMYGVYGSLWRYTTTVAHLLTRARFRLLPAIDTSRLSMPPLPARYVAVRFYFSDCFPDTPENRGFAARVVDGLAARGDVVLLNSDLVVDDHRDFSPERRARVHVLSTHMEPATNLALQTVAISRASAFVGTYGGYSYLAPFYGVSSVAFHSHSTFNRHHLDLAHRVFQRLGPARLVSVDVRQAELLVDALGGLVTTPVSS
jgi:hypothetical protein